MNEPYVDLFFGDEPVAAEIKTFEFHQSDKGQAAGLARQGIVNTKGELGSLRAGVELISKEGYRGSDEVQTTVWRIDWISYDDSDGAKIAMTEVVDA